MDVLAFVYTTTRFYKAKQSLQMIAEKVATIKSPHISPSDLSLLLKYLFDVVVYMQELCFVALTLVIGFFCLIIGLKNAKIKQKGDSNTL